MEKVRPWCGQPSDRGRLKNRNRNRTLQNRETTGRVSPTYRAAACAADCLVVWRDPPKRSLVNSEIPPTSADAFSPLLPPPLRRSLPGYCFLERLRRCAANIGVKCLPSVGHSPPGHQLPPKKSPFRAPSLTYINQIQIRFISGNLAHKVVINT